MREPRVRILVTGSEVRAPGTPKDQYQVYDANSFMLRGLIERDGGVLEAQHRLGDDPEAIRDGAGRARRGRDPRFRGLERGERRPRAPADRRSGRARDPRRRDAALESRRHRPDRRRVGLSAPGQSGVLPLRLRLLCRPCHSCARRAVRRSGRTARCGARSRRKIVSAIGRVDYCRVRIVEGAVEPIALSGASILSSTTRADGFVIVPSESEGYGPGADVTVYLYD